MIKLIDRPELSHSYMIISDVYWQYPVFMLKDGVEYFIGNRQEPELPGGLYFAGIEKFLNENGGAYFFFYGNWHHPLEMLKAMGDKYHFDTLKHLFHDSKEAGISGGHYLDFQGNWYEVSSAFFYLIYDEDLMEAVRKAAAPIVERSRAFAQDL